MMMRHFPVLFAALSSSNGRGGAAAFAPRITPSSASSARVGGGGGERGGGLAMVSSSSSSLLPTVDDVSADDFMKQLGHASRIIPLLHQGADDDDEAPPSDALLLEVLSSQFGHSDGIRGFFATYLTSPESLTTGEDVPPILAEAVRGADAKVMVPLACMNVVMPTAMSSIHQDPELKECASKTATNGKKILRLLKDNDDVIGNCRAITSVCRGLSSSEEEGCKDNLIEYWEKFFVNYKYEEEQKNDIAMAISEFC